MQGRRKQFNCGAAHKKEGTKVLEFYHYTQWHSHLMPRYTIFYNTLYSYSYLYHAVHTCIY